MNILCCKSTDQKESRSSDIPGRNIPVTLMGPDEYVDYKGKYKLWGPAFSGDASECFTAGLLYRIEDGNVWAFYNDTQLYEMDVVVSFEPNTKILNLGSTTMNTELSGWIVVSTIVYPGETQLFCRGAIDLYKCALNPRPLSTLYRRQLCEVAYANVTNEINKIRIRSKDIDEILEYCVYNNILFVDTEFLPNDRSLCRVDIDSMNVDIVPWQRPREYIKSNLKFDVMKYSCIDPKDIRQGSLGDCWFMCALAAVAAYPRRIEKLFCHPVSVGRSQKEESLGAHRVTLNINGWWTTLVIDDYLPVMGGKPVFGMSNKDINELWVSVIEKAYAKARGSYSSISRGDPLSGIKDLTGFPVTRFDTEWEQALHIDELSDKLFDYLLEYSKQQYLLLLNTSGAIPGKEAEQKELYIGTTLQIGHSYNVEEIKFFPKYNLGLFKIQNPWRSSSEWKGKWSNGDASWDDFSDIAEQCSFDQFDRDFIWMEWGDVKRYFSGGGICFYRSNWFDYRIQGSFSGVAPNVVLEVHVTKQVEIFAILSQKDKRGLPDTDPNSKYAGMMLSIARKEGNKYVVHTNSTADPDESSQKYTFSIARDHAIHYVLEPEFSPYLIIPRLYKAREYDKSYVLGILSNTQVDHGFSVNFNTMDPNCKALDNYAKFSYDSMMQKGASTRYQYSPHLGSTHNNFGQELVFPHLD